MMEVVVTTGAIRRAELQIVITNKPTPSCDVEICTLETVAGGGGLCPDRLLCEADDGRCYLLGWGRGYHRPIL